MNKICQIMWTKNKCQSYNEATIIILYKKKRGHNLM